MPSERDLKKLTELQHRPRELRERVFDVTAEVARLHGDICSTVREIFGHESDEFSNITSIKLELPPGLMDAGEALIEDIDRGSRGVGNTEALMKTARRTYIRKRFDELYEAISTCIYTLRRRDR